MSKILTYFISILLLLSLLSTNSVHQIDSCVGNLSIKKIATSLQQTSFPEKKKLKSASNKELTKSDWYASAIKKIALSEYEFKEVASTDAYTTPNRKNNLRFFYDENGFTTEPRIKEGKDWKVAFALDKTQIGKGIWQLNGNQAAYIGDKITVQYINNEQGMRQNFIVRSPLLNDNALKIHFDLNTSLKVQLQEDGLKFIHATSGNVLNYNQLKVWDANNKLLAANFEKDGAGYAIHVNTNDAVYPITIDPISTTPSAFLQSNQQGAHFGVSVSSAGDVNGDGYSDVIVGAYLYDNGQTNEGRAFIFHGSDTGVSAIATTFLESNQADAQFGISVANAGDVNGDGYGDVIVGTNLYDNGQTDEGAAFVYHGSATGVITTAVNTLESNLANTNYGISVATAGDVNGDGYSDIIVGGNLFSSGETNEGVAVVYRGSATGILNATAAILQLNQAGARMGISVASAGDINGDGFSDIIVGAALYNNGATEEGAAIIYTGSSTGINTTPIATLESNQVGARFGISVAGAGDVNGDGYSDVIIGANLYDNGQTDEGAAFIYLGKSTGINLIAADTLEANQASANFGRSVACAGDNNGDGYSDIIIGAYLYDNGQTDEGKAFMYKGSATGIVNAPVASVESDLANAQMALSVASAGDVNGDGYSDVIVGADWYDYGDANEGAAFIYNGSPDGITTTLGGLLEVNQANAQFATSVASAGDVNGDGFSDIIIGAPLFDNGQTDEGRAYVYYGSITGINSNAVPTVLEFNKTGANLGNSVASAGDVNGDGYSDVVVGAVFYANGQNNEGAVLVYHGAASGISTVAADTLESNQVNASFGYSVAGAGDVNSDGYADIIVGASNALSPQYTFGAAYIYYGSAVGISAINSDTLSISQTYATFGNSVASAGDVNGDGYSDVIIGAYTYSNGQSSEGAAFIYNGSKTGIISVAADTLELNRANSLTGFSVASAGDVNGDGFSDVIVGTYLYSNGTSNEGAAFVFHGSDTGVNHTASFSIEGNALNSGMGNSVASAGDVNGDGYSDILIGQHKYTSANANEGKMLIYKGGPNGITTLGGVAIQTSPLQAQSQFGYSVACAGDINGDGYSDVIAGAQVYDNGETDEGVASLYYGNKSGGVRNNFRLYNTNLTTPIQQSNSADNTFGAGLFAKSSLGRQKGKLFVESVRNGISFSGLPITNSTAYTSQSTAYTSMGIGGTEFKNLVVKMNPTVSTNIRARVKYDPATSFTGQVYGPWKYYQPYLTGTTNKIISIVTYHWTGNVSTIWENPANWSSNVVPIATSDVIIPSGRPRYPTVYVGTSIKSISLAPGTSTTLATGVQFNIVGH